MKKVIKNSILLGVMFTTMLSNATEIPSFIVKENLKKTVLTIYNVKKGNQLLIKDTNGIVIYREFILETGSYSKGFDLTTLPNGNYFFELEKDMEIKTIPFSVSANEVSFDKDNEISIFKPVVRSKENLVYISKLALSEESLSVKIYYENTDFEELIHSEVIKNTQVIEKVYKLLPNANGRYKIVMNTNGREYLEYIEF